MKIERTMQCLNCGDHFDVTFEDQAEADHFERSGAFCPRCCAIADGFFAARPYLDDDDDHTH